MCCYDFIPFNSILFDSLFALFDFRLGNQMCNNNSVLFMLGMNILATKERRGNSIQCAIKDRIKKKKKNVEQVALVLGISIKWLCRP